MTEELDRLRAALKSAPPAPDPAAKAQALARAMEKFDEQAAKGQEPDAPARPMSDRPKGAGFLTGVRRMFVNLTSRPTRAATEESRTMLPPVRFISRVASRTT